MQRHTEATGAALDLELGIGVARRCGINRQRGPQCGRGQTPAHAAKLLGRLRSEFLQQRHHAVEGAHVEVERHRAARRLRFAIDATFDRQPRSAEIGDGEPFDLEAVRIGPHADVGLLGLDAGHERACDLERERAFARQVEGRVAEHGLGNRMDTVEIDFRRGERDIEPRRPIVARPGIGQPSGDGHAIELELEPLERDRVAAEGNVAAEAQRTDGRGLLIAASGQPSDERARIVGLQAARSHELHARRRGAQAAADAHLGHAGRAQFQALDVHAIGIDRQVATHARQRCAAEHDALGVDTQRRGDRQPRRRDHRFGQRLDGGERALAHRLRQRQQPIEVDLRRRQRAAHLRLRPEGQIGAAAEFDRPVVRTVLEFDLLQRCACAVSLDAAVHAPRFDDERLRARRCTTDRARELDAAFEARHAALDPNRDVGFGGQRLIDRIDRKAHPRAAVLRDPAGGEAIRITLAGDDERALAFDRPRQRAHLARELQLVEHETGVARAVGEAGAAVLDLQPRDRHPFQIEAEFGDRPSQAA